MRVHVKLLLAQLLPFPNMNSCCEICCDSCSIFLSATFLNPSHKKMKRKILPSLCPSLLPFQSCFVFLLSTSAFNMGSLAQGIEEMGTLVVGKRYKACAVRNRQTYPFRISFTAVLKRVFSSSTYFSKPGMRHQMTTRPTKQEQSAQASVLARD